MPFPLLLLIPFSSLRPPLQHLTLLPQPLNLPNKLRLLLFTLEQPLPQVHLSILTNMQLSQHRIPLQSQLRQLHPHLPISLPQIFILLEQSSLIGLGDHIQLVQTTKLTVILLEVILQMLTLIFKELCLLDQMMVLRTIGSFLLPTWNIQLILAIVIGTDLEIFIKATLATHLKVIGHLFCIFLKIRLKI